MATQPCCRRQPWLWPRKPTCLVPSLRLSRALALEPTARSTIRPQTSWPAPSSARLRPIHLIAARRHKSATSGHLSRGGAPLAPLAITLEQAEGGQRKPGDCPSLLGSKGGCWGELTCGCARSQPNDESRPAELQVSERNPFIFRRSSGEPTKGKIA